MRTTGADDDFDTSQLVTEQRRDIDGIRAELDVLSAKYGDDDKFVQTILAIAEKDRRFESMLVGAMVRLIATNVDVGNALKETIDKVDRAWWRRAGGKIAFAAWSIALLVVGALIRKHVG